MERQGEDCSPKAQPRARAEWRIGAGSQTPKGRDARRMATVSLGIAYSERLNIRLK